MLACARLRFVTTLEWDIKTYLKMEHLNDLER